MAKLMNEKLYEVNYGSVIYDASHPVTTGIIEMDSPAAELKVGTVIAKAEDGSYFILGTDGKTGEGIGIVTETLDFTEEEGTVNVPVYTSIKANKNKLVTANDYELTDADILALRKNGIYIAEAVR